MLEHILVLVEPVLLLLIVGRNHIVVQNVFVVLALGLALVESVKVVNMVWVVRELEVGFVVELVGHGMELAPGN